MVTVKQFADQMGEELYGLHPDDAIAQGICLECRQPALKTVIQTPEEESSISLLYAKSASIRCSKNKETTDARN